MSTPTLTDIATARALRIDPPRNEAKVRIRVSSRSDGHIIAGHRLGLGENTIEVYASDVAAFEREVETRDCAPVREKLAFFDDLRARKLKGEQIADDLLPRFDPSFPAAFRTIYGRDPLPLDRVERIEKPQARAKD